MNKKFAIVLALALIAIVCCAGCILPSGPVDPVDPVDPITPPVDPVVPEEPEDPVVPEEPVDPVVPAEGDFTVTFMMNSAVDSSVYLTVYVDEGESVAEPEVPEKPTAQYIFVKWTTDKENKNAYDFATPVTADLVLYADWDVMGVSSGSSHTHNWGTGVETTAPTCGVAGVLTYTCDCGQTKTESIPATGNHSYGDWVSGEKTCSVCGDVVTCEHPTTALSGTNIVCTVCNENLGAVVAQIGNNYYASFESAMENAVPDEDTIILHAAVQNGVVNKKVVIDTNDNETSLVYDETKGLTVADIKIVKNTVTNKLGTVMFGGEKVVFEVDAEGKYVASNEGYLVVAYTVTGTTYTVYTENGNGLKMALDAINAVVTGDFTVNLAADITGDVTIEQKSNVKITINGDNHKFTGAITVDGKSAEKENVSLTIKNVNFEAESITKDAFINMGVSGDNDTRYIYNLTVKDCTFTNTGTGNIVAIKSYTGGDKNLVIEGCTVYAGMHSLAQLKNVGGEGVQIKDCTVKSVRGISLGHSELTMSNSNFEVQKYAVRFGDSGACQHSSSITGGSLKSTYEGAAYDDAVIVFRGCGTLSTLYLDGVTLSAPEGKSVYYGNTDDTIIIIDGYSVWNGVVPTSMPTKTLVVDGGTQTVHVKNAAAFAYLSTLSSRWVELYTDGSGRTYAHYANGAGANYYYSGKWTVILEANIDLNNHDIEPVVIIFGESTGASTFNGGNHIIRNIKTTTGLFANNNRASYAYLTLENVEATNGALTGSANTNIDNVIVKNAIISGVEYVGGLVGYIYGDVTNCKVIESSITASGKEAGGLIGYIASSSGNGKVTGNEVHEVNVYADNRAAGLVAQANNGVKVYNNIVDTATVGAADTSQYQPNAVISNALVPENVYENSVSNCNVS